MTDDFRTQLASKTDEELLEMLRDRESGDWQPEALVAAAAILTDRGIALPEAEAPPADEAAFVDLVTVAGFMNHVDAEACRSALEAAGFDAIARDTATARSDNLLTPMLGGLRVAVPSGQAEDARAFLKAVEKGEMAAPSSCPSCGSEDTGAETRTVPPEGVADQMMAVLGATDEQVWFRCRACGHEWQ
ncbi:MAG: hypothetical protein ABW221_15650 [Vicinamibacteria bacterium]